MQNIERRETAWADQPNERTKNLHDTERIASAVAGGALVAFGLKQGGVVGTTLSLLGGGLLLRGTTGHSKIYDAIGLNTQDSSKSTIFAKTPSFLSGQIRVKKALTINKSPAELYRYWRNFQNLPNFMRHLESVNVIDEQRSHWKAKAPLGASVEWDATITDDVENQKIGWRADENADIPNSGTVEFRPTANRGTEMIVTIMYEAPGGKIGEWAAWALGEEPNIQVAEDLRRFKMLLESGQIMTVEGQPSGRSESARPLTRAARA